MNQILRHSENVPEHVDFEFIKGLVDSRLEQRLQLMQPILNLQFRLWVDHVAVLVGIRDRRTVTGVRKAQAFGRGREQARFKTGDGLVNQIVDRVNNIIYKRLRCARLAIRFLHPVIRSKALQKTRKDSPRAYN